MNQAVTGKWVYVTREQPVREERIARQHKKLQSKAEGPHLVINDGEHTVTIRRNDGSIEVVSRDGISIAPEPEHDPPM